MKLFRIYKHVLLENYISREEQIKIVTNAPIGSVLPEEYIYNYVQKIHRSYDDFVDGDLGDRIENFKSYKLLEIPVTEIDIVYHMEKDIAAKFGQEFLRSKFYPPIVLDNDYDIIDGTHRLGGLISVGEKLVKAWVGMN